MKKTECLSGELNCPPEDVGSIPGFYNFVEAMSNKKHPEHQEFLDWYGEEYDPEFFDLVDTNIALKQLKLTGKGSLLGL